MGYSVDPQFTHGQTCSPYCTSLRQYSLIVSALNLQFQKPIKVKSIILYLTFMYVVLCVCICSGRVGVSFYISLVYQMEHNFIITWKICIFVFQKQVNWMCTLVYLGKWNLFPPKHFTSFKFKQNLVRVPRLLGYSSPSFTSY